MLRILGGLFLGIFTLTAGCGIEGPTNTSRQDMRTTITDMGMSDLAIFTGPDMAVTLPVPPGCNTTTAVTGTQAYATISGSNGLRCAGGNCHNTNSTKPKFSDRATFMAVMINGANATAYPYVTPSVPDRSYLLYKLRNLQLMLRDGSGTQMPKGGTPLTNAEACTVYNWIRVGAPVN